MLTNSEMVLSEAVRVPVFLHKYFIMRISLETVVNIELYDCPC